MSTKCPFGRNERDATLEILRSSETKLPILKTELPIPVRQFQNERTVRDSSELADFPRNPQVVRNAL